MTTEIFNAIRKEIKDNLEQDEFTKLYTLSDLLGKLSEEAKCANRMILLDSESKDLLRQLLM